jgi:hypothetical protein
VAQEYFLSDGSALNIRDQEFTDMQLGGGTIGNAYNMTNSGEVQGEQ